MKISIVRYPQLQLGRTALTKRHDQNNKAPKIKRRTRTQKHPKSIIHVYDSIQQHACPLHTSNNYTRMHVCTNTIDQMAIIFQVNFDNL